MDWSIKAVGPRSHDSLAPNDHLPKTIVKDLNQNGESLPGEVGGACAEAELRFGVSFAVRQRHGRRLTLCQGGQVWAPEILIEDQRSIYICFGWSSLETRESENKVGRKSNHPKIQT